MARNVPDATLRENITHEWHGFGPRRKRDARLERKIILFILAFTCWFGGLESPYRRSVRHSLGDYIHGKSGSRRATDSNYYAESCEDYGPENMDCFKNFQLDASQPDKRSYS
jgi:hypothetical protein